MLETTLNGPAPQQAPAAWPKRFVDKVDTSAGPDSCWPWTASRTSRGYGKYSLDGRYQQAHRLGYEWSTGEQLGDLQADHICHDRACCNPSHLRPVNNQQNQQNRATAQRNSRSGVRGVFWRQDRCRWHAKVQHHGRKIHVGLFDSLAEAEAAVIAKRLELFTHSDMDERIAASVGGSA